MDLRAQTSFIAALVCAALAANVLLRPRKTRAHWVFSFLCVNFALWYVTAVARSVSQAAPSWTRWHLVFGVLIPLSAVQFFGIFIDAANRRMRRVYLAAYICAFVLLCALVTPFYDHPLTLGALITYVVSFAGLSLSSLYASGKSAVSELEGARLRYISWVGGLGSLFTLLDYMPAIGLDIPPVGTVLILVFLYVLSQSIARYRLVDLYELTGRVGILIVLSFLLAAMIWLLSTVSEHRFFVHGVVSAFVILLVFDPVRARVEAWISQLLFHERFDLEQSVQSTRRQLAHVFDIEELSRVLIKGLEHSRRVTNASLYLVGPEKRLLFVRGSIGEPVNAQIEIAAARPLIEHISERGPVVLETLEREIETQKERGQDREAETLHDIIETLHVLRASVCACVQTERQEFLGLLAVHDERIRDAFSPEEVELLQALATQTAVAIENSRLYDELKERDRLAALGEMAAGLAHEIRNPLGAIKASAQYITDSTPQSPAKQAEFLDIIVDEVNRLNRVVSSFLEYARPGQSNAAAIDINQALERSATRLRSECSEAGVNLDLKFGTELPLARIDQEQLHQVLLNLVRNAVEAMPQGGDIVIETRIREQRHIETEMQHWVEIHVRDTGPGIPKTVLEKIFVPFVTTKQTGTGLGLAICQRIVDQVGGRIEARTKEGAGSTFIISLLGLNPDRISAPPPAIHEPAPPAALESASSTSVKR